MPAVLRGLLASPLAARWTFDPITTYRRGPALRRHRAFLEGVVGLVRWAGRHRGAGVVHIHAAVRGSLYRKSGFAFLARALGFPVLLHVHAGAGDIEEFASGLGPWRRRAFSAALRCAEAVVSVSAAGAEALERCLGAQEVGVVPNAAPVVEEPAPPSDRAPGRVLYLGGWEDAAKGGDNLLAALPQLASLAPGAQVILAGPAPPPCRPTVSGLSTTLVGWLEPQAKEQMLREADIVVFPSVSEGLPVALLEAMAHARAIVATRVGGMPEVLEDDVSGLLVNPGDPTALARALAALINDPPRRARLGDTARSRAARITDEEVTDRLDALYCQLLTRGRRGARPPSGRRPC